MKKELLQLHFQYKDKTEFVEQKLIASVSEMKSWTKNVQENNKLPDGATWMMCNEESEHFVMAVKEFD